MTVCGLVLLWSLAADVAPPAGDAAPLADRPYQGLAVQVHPGRDALKTNTRLIHEVADLGADTVLLSVNGYQKRVESLAILFDGPGAPTDAQWLELFAVAHGRSDTAKRPIWTPPRRSRSPARRRPRRPRPWTRAIPRISPQACRSRWFPMGMGVIQ